MQRTLFRPSSVILLMLTALAFTLLLSPGNCAAQALTPKEQLGKSLYFDTNLSNPVGQSCASCHDPAAGFAEPDKMFPSSAGILGKFGGRNSPSAAYAAFSPKFSLDPATMLYTGGQFWDGRAATLWAQAKGPFLNPVEMNATKKYVVTQVKNSAYAAQFLQVFGPTSLNNVKQAYNLIASAIAAYEKSAEVCSFTSKYDYYLANTPGVTLTAQELKGLDLFNVKGNCAACHPSAVQPNGKPPLLTDFTYDNLGLPQNPKLVALTGNSIPDLGLGGVLVDPLQEGKFKVPTLRNVANSGPYGHNGYFRTLRGIVHFYNTRDVPGAGWPTPEVLQNVNTTEMGNLGLTPAEERAIVAFLKTLTDGYPAP